MPSLPSNVVIGINFSSQYQSVPVNALKAAEQLGKIVGVVKTFSLEKRALDFVLEAKKGKYLSHLAVGSTNGDLVDFAQDKAGGFLDQLEANAISPDMISWICVGNEPLGSWYQNKYTNLLAPAVENLHSALQKRNWKVGVTIPQNFEFMAKSYPPSSGVIKAEFVDAIKRTCAVMKASGAPFMVNIYPYLTYKDNQKDVPLGYCLFTATQNQWVHDGGYLYKNIFDAMVDALHVALEAIGYKDLEIVIGECGWPTAGGVEANPGNAQTFVQNLIDHCQSGAGTPRMPGRKMRCFVFEAYDEDMKSTAPGAFEHHWGVYDANGNAKFPLSWGWP